MLTIPLYNDQSAWRPRCNKVIWDAHSKRECKWRIVVITRSWDKCRGNQFSDEGWTSANLSGQVVEVEYRSELFRGLTTEKNAKNKNLLTVSVICKLARNDIILAFGEAEKPHWSWFGCMNTTDKPRNHSTPGMPWYRLCVKKRSWTEAGESTPHFP